MNYSSLLGSLADFSIEQAKDDKPVPHKPIDTVELLHVNRTSIGSNTFYEEQGVVVSNETVRHDMELATAHDEILSVFSKKNHSDVDWNNYSKSISNLTKSHKQLFTSILLPILTLAICVLAIYLVRNPASASCFLALLFCDFSNFWLNIGHSLDEEAPW